MTVKVTRPRLDATLALIQQRLATGYPPPTNYEIAVCIGVGAKEHGARWKKPEAGSVMVRALEMMGLIEVERIGRRKRIIRLVEQQG